MLLSRRLLRYTVHSPRGVNFDLSPADAVRQIQDTYSRRWFGAQLDYLTLGSPSKEFLPFYLCSGRIHATFVGFATYDNETFGADGKRTSTTSRTVSTQLQALDTVFEENKTQMYAGYKYNIGHVHHALRSDHLSLERRKMHEVNTTGATINLFEQSTSTMLQLVEAEVRAQATETARATVRSYHPAATQVSVEFKSFTFHLDEVTPTFVPCFVVKADYDGERYTLYVSGYSGRVGGPRLLNALYIARVTALATVAVALVAVPNKVAGAIFGLAASVATYYIAFYTARWYPAMRRNQQRRKRDTLRLENIERGGYRPTASSQRIQQEYRSSSYWDTHAYQQRPRTSKTTSGPTSSSSSSSSSSASAPPPIPDPLGYYRALGLHGDESVNEIRSAYRQMVLKQHPDVGGSTEAMVKANEAYRVLRDPQRRAAYDAS
ncbi:DNAJ domain protein [Novymonas esmeraldas]|uniref:DNAJ domain protein n=1 Tax=Novymonas esmeraldas TaxID=1808958 RepID=A0AAW0ELY3_9TRYP